MRLLVCPAPILALIACRPPPDDLGELAVVPLPAGPTVFLRAYAATSGDHADRLLDGEIATTWTATCDPHDEGVHLVFAEPAAVDELHVAGCEGAGRVELVAYLNGVSGPTIAVTGARVEVLRLTDPQSRELIDLRLVVVSTRDGSPACLAEVGLREAGLALTLRPPRAVRGTVVATSVRAPARLSSAGLLFDGRADRGWRAGEVGEQRVEVAFDEAVEVVGVEIDALAGVPAPVVRVEVDGKPPLEVAVAEAGGRATVDLGAVRSVAFVVPAGAEPAALGEIRLIDRHGPYGIVVAPTVEPVEGTSLAKLVDRDWRSVCGYPRRRLKIRAEGGLSAVDPAAAWDGAPVPIAVDASWTPGPADGAWVPLIVDGRIWNAAARWDAATRVRPFAGDLRVARVADLGQAGFSALVTDWGAAHADRVDCLTEELGAWPDAWQALLAGDAFVVQGGPWTDLMWHEIE